MADPETPTRAGLPVTHVIFDLDGLLLDTEPLYSEVFRELCGRHGHDYDWALKARVMGRTAPEAARVVVEALGLPVTPAQLMADAEARLDQLMPSARLMPGAEALLLHLRRHRVPFALATSSSSASFARKSSAHGGLFRLFSHVVLGDDPEVARGKPAPDIFLACARRFQPAADPEACLVFEDAPHGVAAAVAAGMRVVHVPDPNLRGASAGATAVLRSLEDFRPEAFGLPAFA